MKNLLLAIPALALALPPMYGAVDPGLLNLVMPDAALVAGLQVEQAQTSPFGRFLLSQIKPGNPQDKLLAATGFDPLRDLKEVVVAATSDKNGVVLGRGVFQPGRIAAAATLAGATATTYKGIQILSGGGGKNSALAFLDASTVAIGNAAALEGVIDRRIANAFYNGALTAPIRDTSGLYDAWFAAASPLALVPSRLSSGNDVPVRVLQTIQQVSGGVKLGADNISVTADALTASSQDAQALADVLRFLVSMVQNDPKAPPVLSAAQFTANGATTRASFEITEKQAEELFADHHAPAIRQNRNRNNRVQ